MIHTSKQLKDKVRNVSKGDNNIAKNLIRNFMMERSYDAGSYIGPNETGYQTGYFYG